MGFTRRALVGLAGTGAAALITIGVIVAPAYAETPTPGSTPTAQTGGASQDYRQVFVSKLAAALGIDQTKLTDSMKAAQVATIDEAVQKGDLSQTRADQLKQRAQQGDLGTLGGFGGRGGDLDGAKGGKGATGAAYQAAQQAAADKLGLTLQDLQTQLRQGTSLADLASSKGVAAQDVYSAMAAAAKPQLDQQVQAGTLTQQQADSILQRIQQGQMLGRAASRGGADSAPGTAPRGTPRATATPTA